MTEDEERTIKAFQSTVTEMRHELEKNPRANQSWKDRIPYKKVDDLSKLNEDSTNVEVEGQSAKSLTKACSIKIRSTFAILC